MPFEKTTTTTAMNDGNRHIQKHNTKKMRLGNKETSKRSFLKNKELYFINLVFLYRAAENDHVCLYSCIISFTSLLSIIVSVVGVSNTTVYAWGNAHNIFVLVLFFALQTVAVSTMIFKFGVFIIMPFLLSEDESEERCANKE